MNYPDRYDVWSKRLFAMLVAWSGLALLFLCTVAFVPAKYYPFPTDVDQVNAVDIPGAKNINHYSIQGTNTNELMEEIKVKGQEGIGGAAITMWSVNWTFVESDPGSPTCRPMNISITYIADVVIPRWINPQDAIYLTIWDYKTYLKRTAWHEAQHVRIVLDGVADMRRVLEESDCGSAFEAAVAVEAEITRRHNEFDHQEYGAPLDRTPIRRFLDVDGTPYPEGEE